MKNEKRDRALREAFASLQPEKAVKPPTAEALTALREGTVSAEDAEDLLDRAVKDAAAARLMLDAKQFPDFEPTAEEQAAVEAFSAKDGWQSLRGQLQQDRLLATSAPKPDAPMATPEVRWRWFEIGAIAAALLVGLGLGLVWPRGASEPIVNPAVVELTAGVVRSSEARPLAVRSSPGGLELVIDVTEYAATDSPFEIQLVAEDSQEKPWIVFVAAAEERRYRGTIRAVWPEMPALGHYRVRIRQTGEIFDLARIRIID